MEENSKVTYHTIPEVMSDLSETTTEINIPCYRICTTKGIEICKDLQVLALVSNCIPKIEPNVNIESLRVLDLYQNSISIIENLDKCTFLNTLDLSFNKIINIQGLDNLKNLTNLYLTSNLIKEITGLSNLQQLIVLELGSNNIECLGGLYEIEGLETLKELWLGKNNINEFKNINLPNIIILSLQSNRLSTLDDNLSGLNTLEELYLSENKFSVIPSVVYSMKRLKVLDLAKNNITDLGELDKLENLEELWLNDNLIESIENIDAIRRLKKLSTLYLYGNPLKQNLGPSYRNNICKITMDLKKLDAFTLNDI